MNGFRPSDIPAKPGVYVYRDRFGEVIYVGKAANLRRRMSQYFQPSRESRADPKLRSLVASIDSWEFFTVRSEDESLLLESRFIKEYAPRYNILLRDDKRYPMLKIDRAEKFPRIRLTRLKKNDGALYYGPFPHGTALRTLAEYLTKRWGLRSCKTACPGPDDRRHCMAGTVRDCCRPCDGTASEEEYTRRLESAIAVLDGSIHDALEDLTIQMTEAASKQQFEKAALYRDVIANMKALCGGKLRSFERAELPTDAGAESVADLGKALGLPNPPEMIEGFDISNIGGTLAVASLVQFRHGKPDKSGYRRFRIKTVEGSNDFAMMREAVTRHFQHILSGDGKCPDLLMVDGGKGQLSSALDALVALDVPPFPVIGLAKKHEEIFVPGREDPVVLDRTRPALKLLQALRDEAHRFAVSYHRELRMKRIEESVLDEIEGLGEARKIAILREFGSVAMLRKASAEEIARRVPGVGPVLAQTVHDYLAARQ